MCVNLVKEFVLWILVDEKKNNGEIEGYKVIR